MCLPQVNTILWYKMPFTYMYIIQCCGAGLFLDGSELPGCGSQCYGFGSVSYPWIWIRIKVRSGSVTNFSDQDPYQHDTDPPHWR